MITIKDRISVRLNSEAIKRCDEAIQAGYRVSDFVNQVITGTAVKDLSNYREIAAHLCQIETLTEHLKDADIKDSIREETAKLWQYLK